MFVEPDSFPSYDSSDNIVTSIYVVFFNFTDCLLVTWLALFVYILKGCNLVVSSSIFFLRFWVKCKFQNTVFGMSCLLKLEAEVCKVHGYL
jgi:hypothetical protein